MHEDGVKGEVEPLSLEMLQACSLRSATLARQFVRDRGRADAAFIAPRERCSWRVGTR
jgi:hypothetical protein